MIIGLELPHIGSVIITVIIGLFQEIVYCAVAGLLILTTGAHIAANVHGNAVLIVASVSGLPSIFQAWFIVIFTQNLSCVFNKN